MRNLLIIAMSMLCLHSCKSPEEILARQDNRDAKELEKLLIKRPNLLEGREVEVPVALMYPGAQSTISRKVKPGINVDSLLLLAQTNADGLRAELEALRDRCLCEPVIFVDEHIELRVALEDGQAVVDYSIKPQEVAGEVTLPQWQIKPTEHKPLPKKWWENVLAGLGALFVCGLIVMLAYVIMIHRLNKD